MLLSSPLAHVRDLGRIDTGLEVGIGSGPVNATPIICDEMVVRPPPTPSRQDLKLEAPNKSEYSKNATI